MRGVPDPQEVAFICPFCGGEARAQAGEREAVVLHTMPMCSQFERLQADEYIHAVRVRYQASHQ